MAEDRELISYTEPERQRLISDRALRFDILWRAGQIGDNTYLRSLLIDGMPIDEARGRLGLLKMDKASGLAKLLSK